MEFPLAVQSHEAVLQPAYAQVGFGFARTFVPLPQSGGSYILIAAFVAAILLIAGVISLHTSGPWHGEEGDTDCTQVNISFQEPSR